MKIPSPQASIVFPHCSPPLEPRTLELKALLTLYADLLIDRWSLTPRRIFLVDGLGALGTILGLLLLGQVFHALDPLPRAATYLLLLLASIMAVFSLGCFFSSGRGWRSRLAAIGSANAAYCLLLATLIALHFSQLSVWTVTYFAVEMLLVAVLVALELRIVIRRAGGVE